MHGVYADDTTDFANIEDEFLVLLYFDPHMASALTKVDPLFDHLCVDCCSTENCNAVIFKFEQLFVDVDKTIV